MLARSISGLHISNHMQRHCTGCLESTSTHLQRLCADDQGYWVYPATHRTGPPCGQPGPPALPAQLPANLWPSKCPHQTFADPGSGQRCVLSVSIDLVARHSICTTRRTDLYTSHLHLCVQWTVPDNSSMMTARLHVYRLCDCIRICGICCKKLQYKHGADKKSWRCKGRMPW